MRRILPPQADADPIARARALLQTSEPTTADLERCRDDLEQHAVDAEAEISRLTADRPNSLATGSRADVSALDDNIAGHAFARDQAHAIGVRLRESLAQAVEAERRARAASDRNKAEALVSEAVAALAGYPDAVRAVLGIVGIVAHADRAVADFHVAHPAEPRISGAEERARSTPATITKGEAVRGWSWAREDGTILDRAPHESRPIPDDRRMQTETGSPGPLIHPANAALLVEGHPRPSGRPDGSMVPTPWYQRDFLSEIAEHRLAPNAGYVFRLHNGPRVHPIEVWRTPVETRPADHPTPLAEAIVLPGLRVGGTGWHGHDGSPAEILAALARAPVDPRKPQRKIDIEQVVETGTMMALPPSAKPSVPNAPAPDVPREQEFGLDPLRMVGAA